MWSVSFLGKESCLPHCLRPHTEQGTEEKLSKHSHIPWGLPEGIVYIPFHTFLTTKTFALFLKSIIIKCIFLCSGKLKFVGT